MLFQIILLGLYLTGIIFFWNQAKDKFTFFPAIRAGTFAVYLLLFSVSGVILLFLTPGALMVIHLLILVGSTIAYFIEGHQTA